MSVHIFYNTLGIQNGASTIYKAHQVYLDNMRNDFNFHNNISYNQAINFIKSNIDNKMLVVVYWTNTHFCPQLLKFVMTLENPSIKILFITFDFWPHRDMSYISPDHKYFISNIFHAKNHYVMTYSRSVEEIKSVWNFDATIYNNKIISHNIWSCYPLAFVPFNTDPIIKVAQYGGISELPYPERFHFERISKINHNMIVIRNTRGAGDYNGNAFNKRLSQYISCFTSSIHIYHRKDDRYINSHIILLKIFEIIASGSLLLCPKTEESYLAEIGLINMKNCIVTEMDKIEETVEFIVNPKNRDLINKIRLEGYKHAKNNLNSQTRYTHLKEKLLELLHK